MVASEGAFSAKNGPPGTINIKKKVAVATIQSVKIEMKTFFVRYFAKCAHSHLLPVNIGTILYIATVLYRIDSYYFLHYIWFLYIVQ